MLCPIMKKTRLSSAKIQGGQCVCVFGWKEWENEPISKLLHSISSERVSQEEFGKGQRHYSCQ